MQGKSTAQTPSNASAAFGPLSRRSFLSAVGISAAVPATALASVAPTIEIQQLTDEEQLEACMKQIEVILLRMRPDRQEVYGGHVFHNSGDVTVMVGVRRASVEWSGDGYYEVDDRHSRNAVPFWITREWSAMDRRHYLMGAVYFEGDLVAPREVIDPGRIRRKLEGAPV
ncbi:MULTISPECIES: hypothetical protein [unclassified Rhizobium]|uniref:hypothetical protein n=1 Tax=unclassified Rhizobium TaxID=2613769 RepID=UPI00160FEE78|nr:MULTISPECIES: hypothetical protein [unclassified Rhizobium]MBB3289917.1 hypothetical protein [Rhizobium sp. BK252]MBB3404146.1 hypothetical protein [Rhizobium sp. BK289]MBB3417245.1 hypothetical protein [Rhizobium sp. BK284]MBB3485122.1 hypothetical protein [Rhizobium sp. BK347]